MTPEEKEYQRKLEEQKKLRLEVLRKKEENRQKAAREKEAELAARTAARNTNGAQREQERTTQSTDLSHPNSDDGRIPPSDPRVRRQQQQQHPPHQGQTNHPHHPQHTQQSQPRLHDRQDGVKEQSLPVSVSRPAVHNHKQHQQQHPQQHEHLSRAHVPIVEQRRQIVDDLKRKSKEVAHSNIARDTLTPSQELTHSVLNAPAPSANAKKVQVIRRNRPIVQERPPGKISIVVTPPASQK